MTMIVCVTLVTLISYYLSDFIKKYSSYTYIVMASISIIAVVHSILLLNNYTIEYVVGIKQLMKAIDSGALGGAFLLLVMYMGVFDMKYNFSRKLRMIRAELSIIGCIVIIPHNIHYFFAFLLNVDNIVQTRNFSLWINLMMFASGFFAIAIMIPLFITSFRYFRKKMNAKSWKNLQEFAYIFYAMIFVQVIMVYLGKPSSLMRNINLIFYLVLFGTYTALKIRLILSKWKKSKKVVSDKVFN